MILVDADELRAYARERWSKNPHEKWQLLHAAEVLIDNAPTVCCAECVEWREAIGSNGEGNGRHYCYKNHKLSGPTHACTEHFKRRQ